MYGNIENMTIYALEYYTVYYMVSYHIKILPYFIYMALYHLKRFMVTSHIHMLMVTIEIVTIQIQIWVLLKVTIYVNNRNNMVTIINFVTILTFLWYYPKNMVTPRPQCSQGNMKKME